MAPGLPDRVDCAHLADNAVVLERIYPLSEMPRLEDLLADPRGSVFAKFVFAKVDSGRPGATVAVEAIAQLVCQRCLQSFASTVTGSSEIEFTSGAERGTPDPRHEVYAMDEGLVSLRELPEEELLLALPIVAMHAPQACGRAPAYEAAGGIETMSGDRSRPFTDLQNLLKKT